ncbi:MAG: zf-TFIIB domain-containing protein [Candidatus Binatia bacterium]
MRRCPRCFHLMRMVKKSAVTLEQCAICKGAWFDQETLVKLWARVRQLQMASDREHKEARPRPGLYDLDHVDRQRPSMAKADHDKRWSELLEIFE